MRTARCWVASPDGTGSRQVTHPKGDEQDDTPRWSPNGQQIAFSRGGQVFSVPSQGGSVRLIYADPGAYAASPTFAGSRTLVFDRCGPPGVRVVNGIYRVGANGHGLTQITDVAYACTAASTDWTRASE